MAHRLSWLLLLGLVPQVAAQADVPHFATYGAGDGPQLVDGTYHVLDEGRTPGQNNSLGFDAPSAVAVESFRVTATLRVDEGGEGGAFVFLSTADFGERGPAPFVPSWSAPDLAGSLAVAIDVHDPPTEEPFGPWGNYQSLPEREVSLHWDGRELVKRVAPVEFRGQATPLSIDVRHVPGGAEVTVVLGEGVVYDRHFVANAVPYRWRLAVGAETRQDAATVFDVSDLDVTLGAAATPARRPLHVDVFHRVLTDNSTTSYEAEVDLPPLDWAFGRVLLTLDIHDAGTSWDEWDRNGDLFIQDDDGRWLDILPFITSYRTECHWVVDMTDFRPLLSGRRRFRIVAGTTFYKNRGYAMSVSLDYHHGAPTMTGGPRDGELLQPLRVTPLWDGGFRHGDDPEWPFPGLRDPFDVTIGEDTRAARLRITTSGHSPVGEFTPASRSIAFTADVTADEAPFVSDDVLWKTDCYLNPNRPQFGTWKYSRAGWAPGDVVRPWWIQLTPHLRPGATARIAYLPAPYEFGEGSVPKPGDLKAAQHVVRGFLIEYGEAGSLLPAPILRIANVAGGSAAADAGLKAGDYLARYDGRRVDSQAELGEAKSAAVDAGRERVEVEVYRGGERLVLEIATGQMGINLAEG